MAPIPMPTLEPPIPWNKRQSWDQEEEIYYPDSDGEPMAETQEHRKKLTYLTESLEIHFEDQPMVYVSGNMFLYYVQGNPHKSVAPDVFIAFGVPQKVGRKTYKVWEENNIFPQVIVELTSNATKKEDETDKLNLYRTLGVKEYFQYDPTQDYLSPPLKGRRFRKGKPEQAIPGTWLSSTHYYVKSTVLDLEFHWRDNDLWVFNPKTQEYLRTHAQEHHGRLEEAEARQQAEKRAQQEAEARQQAEKRAQQEAEARQQAEAHAKEIEAQLQALLAKLGQQEQGKE